LQEVCLADKPKEEKEVEPTTESKKRSWSLWGSAKPEGAAGDAAAEAAEAGPPPAAADASQGATHVLLCILLLVVDETELTQQKIFLFIEIFCSAGGWGLGRITKVFQRTPQPPAEAPRWQDPVLTNDEANPDRREGTYCPPEVKRDPQAPQSPATVPTTTPTESAEPMAVDTEVENAAAPAEGAPDPSGEASSPSKSGWFQWSFRHSPEELERLEKEKQEKVEAEAKAFAEKNEEEKAGRILERVQRVEAFFAGKLEPYVEPPESTEERNSRLGKAALTGLKEVANFLPLGRYATGARGFLKTADFAAKYGVQGAAAFLLREDFAQAIDILRTLTGDVDVGVTDLAGGMYYLMGHKRGERGNHPHAEAEEHADLEPLSHDELHNFLYWLPMAVPALIF